MKTIILVEHQTLNDLARIPGFLGIVGVNGEALHVTDSLINHPCDPPACMEPARRARRNKQDAAHPGFEEFWNAYPRRCPRRVRSTALAAWDKARPDLATILKALEWQDQLDDWLRDDGQYIPAPSVWLNQRRWEMERVEEFAF